MYPAEFVQPMRDELTAVGFKQLNEVAQVEKAISAEGTTLVVVNSVCDALQQMQDQEFVFL